MTIDSRQRILKRIKQRLYLNRDFDSFKQDLLEYARTNFPESVQDFSEASLPGLLLDMAAYIGDVQSFYLDHQFHELNPERAVENENIESHLNREGVPIVGAAPAVVLLTIFIEVPATGNPPVPNTTALPIIHAGTVSKADNGTNFEIVEDIDFSETDSNGNLKATVTISNRNNENVPTSFILRRKVVAISGFRQTDSFTIGSFTPFRRLSLSKENVTEIISAKDDEGNEYYEVGNLTEDTVFKAIVSRNPDNELVKDNLVPIPAPYRFIKRVGLNTRLTTITLGGGNAKTLNDDAIPDPSEFSIPLYGKRTFSRFTINPSNLLQTNTLGAVTPNTTLSVTYRYGGGLSHNVKSQSIRDFTKVIITFPNDPSPSVAQSVRNSLDVTNERDAAGGEDPPTIDDLKNRIPAVRASQGRIVTKPDLLARIYTMPSNFGRVFRAAVHPNPINPLASRLFIVSRNSENQLITSPDSLKINLSKYLNQFRLIPDAIDILDGRIINVQIFFSVVIDPAENNKNIVLQTIISRLRDYFAIKNFEMDQPIVLADLQNIIYNNESIISVNSIDVRNVFGTVGEGSTRVYSSSQFDIDVNTVKNIIFGPPGSIFEVRYPQFDIIGTAI